MDSRVTQILDSLNICYKLRMHSKEAFTAIDAANERGVRLEQIVKTILLKGLSEFFVVLLPGNKKLSWKKINATIVSKKKSVRLATREEIEVITGYPIGAVSPLGLRDQNLKIYADRHIFDETYVDISSGELGCGVELLSEALKKAINLEIGKFTE